LKTGAETGRRCWLRRIGLLLLAFVIVIGAMAVFCLSSPSMLAALLAVLLVLTGLLLLFPPPAHLVTSVRAFARSLLIPVVFVFIAVVAYANVSAVLASSGRIFDDVSKVPKTKVGLVFGTTDRVNGRENLYFRYRIDAAVALWKAGKMETVIVSGDNETVYYNEPDKMKRALTERGIPADRIVCDFAGFRTLDSVVRAKEVFGTTSVLFISQRFQNERAIYLAKAHGIEAYGFEAEDVDHHGGLKTKLREIGARVKMWLDVNILHTGPKLLGKRELLPE
jgi:SanA protein